MDNIENLNRAAGLQLQGSHSRAKIVSVKVDNRDGLLDGKVICGCMQHLGQQVEAAAVLGLA